MAPPAPQEPATGVKQTIQARHGVATYVPQGYTIKIINTYGKQVVDTWAFALHAPPEDSDIEKGEKRDIEKEEAGDTAGIEQKIKDAVESSSKAVMGNGKDPEIGNTEKEKTEEGNDEAEKKTEDVAEQAENTLQSTEAVADETDVTAEKAEEEVDQVESKADSKAEEKAEDKVEEKVEDKAEDKIESKAEDKTEGVGEGTDEEVAKEREKGSTETAPESETTATKVTEKAEDATPKKSRWSAYIPSLQRTKTQAKKKDKPAATTADDSTSRTWGQYLGVSGGQKDGSSSNMNSQKKGWSAYIPSGQGFSSYMPSKDTLSAFAGSHYMDPTKSYAEQLYDFSKTPVGAAGLSAATGSGYAGSIYAAYKAYEQTAEGSNQPAMEYMSMMHSRASTLHLSPRVGDTLVSNLRAPLLTVLEDTSSGVHDTLIAACDPQRYKELGVEKWEEHGSCSENCVLALKEINERSGLRGKRAIGSDVTVNTVPAPLNLFMNIPWTQKGDVSFEEPKTKRGDYIKFRAERDVVIVMSACPQDILAINGHKPMVAHFVVESSNPRDLEEAKKKEQEAETILAKARRRMSSRDRVPKARQQEDTKPTDSPQAPLKPEELSNAQSPSNQPRPGRRAPRKLEKRNARSATRSPGPKTKS